jgi:hypothetical protein
MPSVNFKNPATDTWIDLVAGSATLTKYVHIFNYSRDPANIVLAIKDVNITALVKPASGSVTPTGAAGTTKYQYYVSAVNDLGETEPYVYQALLSGYDTLDDTNNYHTISWAESGGATKYRIYVCVNDLTWYMKEVLAPTTSVVNDGTWNLSDPPLYANMTDVVCLLDSEVIPAGSIVQMSLDLEMDANEKLCFMTSNSQVALYARYTEG